MEAPKALGGFFFRPLRSRFMLGTQVWLLVSLCFHWLIKSSDSPASLLAATNQTILEALNERFSKKRKVLHIFHYPKYLDVQNVCARMQTHICQGFDLLRAPLLTVYTYTLVHGLTQRNSFISGSLCPEASKSCSRH